MGLTAVSKSRALGEGPTLQRSDGVRWTGWNPDAASPLPGFECDVLHDRWSGPSSAVLRYLDAGHRLRHSLLNIASVQFATLPNLKNLESRLPRPSQWPLRRLREPLAGRWQAIGRPLAVLRPRSLPAGSARSRRPAIGPGLAQIQPETNKQINRNFQY